MGLKEFNEKMKEVEALRQQVKELRRQIKAKLEEAGKLFAEVVEPVKIVQKLIESEKK